MTTESSLPSYSRLFPDLDLRGADDTRSVCSPAAYLADLLQLLHDHFENPALVQRRPAIEGIPLDAANTYTTLPYLDIVNEVLAAAIGTSGAFETLGTDRYPAALPFVLRDERVRVLLGHLGVDAAELYVLFAEVVDPDKTARLRLGRSVDDVPSARCNRRISAQSSADNTLQASRRGQLSRAATGSVLRNRRQTSCRSVRVSAISVLLRRQSSASQDSIRVEVR
jgi:hypothetical protein